MDRRTHKQLEAFWPDVAGPFAEIIPHGCSLLRAEDEWRLGDTRRRLVDLHADEEAPSIEDLADEACDDAIREGWTALHEDGETPRFELENVILRIETATCPILLGSMPVLRVQFEQAWPADYGAPVETSEMFQNLVRNLLHLGAEPDVLKKLVVFDPVAVARADILDERVELPCTENLLPRFDALSFVPPDKPGDAWTSTTTSGDYSIVAKVTKQEGRVSVRMEKRRLVS